MCVFTDVPILFPFYFTVSWSGETTYKVYEERLSEMLDFDLGAVTGWNFVVIFPGQEVNIFSLRKEMCTSDMSGVKEAGLWQTLVSFLPIGILPHFIHSFIFISIIISAMET